MFQFLEFVIRGEPRVWVVETNDEAKRDKVVAEVIEPAAAISRGGEGIAHGMDDFALTENFGLHLPNFLHAQAVGLGLAVSSQFEFPDHLFGETPMAALCEQRDSGVKFHASLKRRFGLPGPADPQVICSHALDGSVIHII